MSPANCLLPPGEPKGDLPAWVSGFSFKARLLLLCVFPADRAGGFLWKGPFRCHQAGTLRVLATNTLCDLISPQPASQFLHLWCEAVGVKSQGESQRVSR